MALLRRCRLRSRVRAAREAQAARFPLTEALWRQWIEDEVDAAERCVLAASQLRHARQAAPVSSTACEKRLGET